MLLLSQQQPSSQQGQVLSTGGSGRQVCHSQGVKLSPSLAHYVQGASVHPNTPLRQIVPCPWSNWDNPSPCLQGWGVLELTKTPKEIKPDLGGKDTKQFSHIMQLGSRQCVLLLLQLWLRSTPRVLLLLLLLLLCPVAQRHLHVVRLLRASPTCRS